MEKDLRDLIAENHDGAGVPKVVIEILRERLWFQTDITRCEADMEMYRMSALDHIDTYKKIKKRLFEMRKERDGINAWLEKVDPSVSEDS